MSKIKVTFVSFIIVLVGLPIYYFYPEGKLPRGIEIDRMIVYKSKRQLLVYSKGKLQKTYTIALGRQPDGAKQFEGDRKTPEGVYYINDKNPNSGWHKNLGISYPNQEDIKYARQLGKSPGGNIKIHGLQNKRGYIGKMHRWKDWTLGCIAVTNEEMDELYRAVVIGTKIEILP
jgi:murein L,D-transpeptidase YafK